MSKPVGLSEFVEKSEALYGKGYFDYTNSIYGGRFTRLQIHCNTCHKDFSEKPFSHLAGKGCLLCGACEIVKNRFISNKNFIDKVKQVHGDCFDFSKTVYIGFDKPVTLHCKKCNKDFVRIAQAITQGKGCPECKKVENLVKKNKDNISTNTLDLNDQGESLDADQKIQSDIKKAKEPSIHMFGRKAFTKETYIKRAELVHGEGVFDYSDMNFSKTSKPIKFKCLTCLSIIERNANYHINTNKIGCPFCRKNSKISIRT